MKIFHTQLSEMKNKTVINNLYNQAILFIPGEPNQ
jgi:hypothetical protein